MRPVALAVAWTGTVFHEYEYGPVPPEAVAVALPVPPLQSTLTCVVLTLRTVGCVIVTEAVFMHPFESVTVTVYVPAPRLFAVAVAWTGTVFHE